MNDRLAGKTLLIFDVDGTIANTSPIHARAFNEVLVPWGLSVDYETVAGMTTDSAFRLILTKAAVSFSSTDIADLVEKKRNAARRLLPDAISFIPGAGEFLRFAHKRYALAVFSLGSRKTVEMTLQFLGIDRIFELIVTSEDVSRPKPHPNGILLILKTLGTPARQALMFEDTAIGAEAGINGGVDVIQISSSMNIPSIPGVLWQSDWPKLLSAFKKHSS